MSKISEQKALEVYPKSNEEPYSTGFINQETFNVSKRTGYIKGYDQAMQDFLEKACEWLNENQDIYFGTSCIYRKELFEDFKKHMQDEM